MGGGGDSQSSSTSTTQENTTQVITNTTTYNSFRDIGLTGQNAVDLAGVIEAGTTDRAAIAADAFKTAVMESGKGYQTLVSGALDLLKQGQTQQNAIIAGSQGLTDLAGKIQDSASDTWKGLEKIALLLTIGGGAVYLLSRGK